MISEITSRHNPRIQQVYALLNQKSARDEEKRFVVEGVRLAEEAIAGGAIPDEVYFSPSLSERGKKLVDLLENKPTDIYRISEELMRQLSATETSQGILLVLPQKSVFAPVSLNFGLVLDGVRDPGNMGTILRSAAAAGVQAVFLPSGNADVFSPKVVRAGMGAHFRLNFIQQEWPEIIHICKTQANSPLQIFLAESSGGKDCWQENLRQPLALVIGGEANGASDTARQAVDSLIHIPMPGKFESLNAAVAAGILLFEVVRQRSQS